MNAERVIDNMASMGGHGICHVYRVDPEFQGSEHLAVVVYDGDGIGWANKGVEVFLCDPTGWVPVMDTVHRSYEIKTHDAVMADLGYTVGG